MELPNQIIMDNSIYRWVKADKDNLPKTEGGHLIRQHPHVAYYCEDIKNVWIEKGLQFLVKVEADQDELWDKIAQRMYHENDDEEWLKNNFHLTPKQ